MGVEISGDNITVPGQVAILLPPTSLYHAISARYAGSLKGYVQALDLNAGAPIDLTALTINAIRYVPIRCIVYNPTANLALATLGLYTAAGGGGVAIVAPVVLATLTGAGKFQSLSIAALTDVVTATTLYPRLTVASGVIGTAALLLEYVDLSLI